ncbi:MAG: VWA domain-containing protein [Thermoproteales archaeon]|nr:VWA domain-containing protein [Thermoproteales archaeon]
MMQVVDVESMYIFLLLIVCVAISHFVNVRIWRRLYTFKHSMTEILLKYLKGSKTRSFLRLIALGSKLLLALSISLMIISPIVTEYKVVKVQVEKELSVDVRQMLRTPVVLVLDASGSMLKEDRGIAKILVAKNASISFVESLPPGFIVGFIAFSDKILVAEPLTDNRSTVVEDIKGIKAGGGTLYSVPLSLAYSWLKPYTELNSTAFVVFVTDGLPYSNDVSVYRKLLPEFSKKGIKIYTIFIGRDEKGKAETVFMAKETGGKQFTAETISELPGRLQEVGKEISYTTTIKFKIERDERIEVKIPLYRSLALLALFSALFLWMLNIRLYKLVA